MADRRHLSRAPITEAIVDLRVKASADLVAEKFSEIKSRLMPQYPKMATMHQHDSILHLDAEAGPTHTSETRVRGIRFTSADDLEIVQFRIDGFTFNRLAPYTSGDDILPKAMRGWDIYRESAVPESVTRVALRYINQMALPEAMSDFDEVLAAPPPIPARLPQTLSRFLTRVTIHTDDGRAAAHITQTLRPGGSPGEPKLILDIDCYVLHEENPSNDMIEENLALLRDFKNDIFFESLTDDFVKRFE